MVKEYRFIVKNGDRIMKNAEVLYNQKTNTAEIFHDRKPPNYLASVVDFLYAEQKCLEYIAAKEKAETEQHSQDIGEQAEVPEKPWPKPSVRDRLSQLRQEAQTGHKTQERNERDPR